MTASPATAPRQPAPARGAPLTYGQEALWLLDQLEPGDTSYNMGVAMRVSGPLRPAALERCVREVVARHEALRTTFAEAHGEPVQVLADSTQLPVAVEDAAEAEAEAQLLAAWREPFDLARGPLARVRLWRVDEEEHLFLLVVHHAVADGWSLNLFFTELAQLYEAFLAGAASALPPVTGQLADFARRQRAALGEEVVAAELGHWRETLAGAPPTLDLVPGPPRPSLRGGRVTSTLAAATAERAAALARSERATLFMTLLAGFDAVLVLRSGQEDLLVGTPATLRSEPGDEGVFGLLTNLVVLRTDASGSPSFRELVRRVRDTCLDAFAHHELPFELLAPSAGIERVPGRRPLVQVTFALQNSFAPTWRFGGLEWTSLEAHPGTAPFELGLIAEEREDGLLLTCVHDGALFDEEWVRGLLADYRSVLDAGLDDPNRPCNSLLQGRRDVPDRRLPWHA